MSKEYIISVPDDAGFVEYSYIRGGRKYNTHYAYRSMECLVRCRECKWFDSGKNDSEVWSMCTRHWGKYFYVNDDSFCSYGERKDQ